MPRNSNGKGISQGETAFIIDLANKGTKRRDIAELCRKEFNRPFSYTLICAVINERKKLETKVLIEEMKNRAALGAQVMQPMIEETICKVFEIVRKYTNAENSEREVKLGLEAANTLNKLIQNQLCIINPGSMTNIKPVDSQAVLDRLLSMTTGNKENIFVLPPKEENKIEDKASFGDIDLDVPADTEENYELETDNN